MSFLKNIYSQFLFETQQSRKKPVENYSLNISDLPVDVCRKMIKNMHLRVYPPNGQVRVSVPLHIPDTAVQNFVRSKLSWIRQQQEKLKQHQWEPPRLYESGEKHYIWGNEYELAVIPSFGASRVSFENKRILLYCRKNISKEKKAIILQEWYRDELKDVLPELIRKWEDIIGVRINEWGVKKMKTKWGTCNRKAKRIWLNLELVKKSLICLEYVIAHELMHLIERYHNKRFKNLMTHYMPNWKTYRAKLNRIPLSNQNKKN